VPYYFLYIGINTYKLIFSVRNIGAKLIDRQALDLDTNGLYRCNSCWTL